MVNGISTRCGIGIHLRPIWINLSVLMALSLVSACRTRGLQETAGRLDSRGFGGKPLTVEETMAFLPLRERGQFAPIARKWMRTDTM